MKKNIQKVSLIATIYNEEKSILSLLESIYIGTKIPDEFIIVDAFSKDKTLKIIENFKIKNKHLNIKIFQKKGNRSIGRNYAISKAKFELIACTDAGCLVDKNWLKNLLLNKQQTLAEVVAGYAKGDPNSNFEKAILPYILVMPDRIDEKNYLPATRSMLMEKKVWKKLGGFDIKLKESEDYDFAHRILENGFKISFAKDAFVYWQSVNNLKDFFKISCNFARGDVLAGLMRKKSKLVFFRYIFFLFLAIFVNFYKTYLLLPLIIFSLFIYSLLAIFKNRNYFKEAFYYYPIIQITVDLAVIAGSLVGFKDFLRKKIN